jgi:hypothetical protein
VEVDPSFNPGRGAGTAPSKPGSSRDASIR